MRDKARFVYFCLLFQIKMVRGWSLNMTESTATTKMMFKIYFSKSNAQRRHYQCLTSPWLGLLGPDVALLHSACHAKKSNYEYL